MTGFHPQKFATFDCIVTRSATCKNMHWDVNSFSILSLQSCFFSNARARSVAFSLSQTVSDTRSFCLASLLIYPSWSVCVWGRWCCKSRCFCVLIFCVCAQMWLWFLPVCVAQPQARQACVVFTQQAHGTAFSLGHNTCFEGKRRAVNRCRLETLCLTVCSALDLGSYVCQT